VTVHICFNNFKHFSPEPSNKLENECGEPSTWAHAGGGGSGVQHLLATVGGFCCALIAVFIVGVGAVGLERDRSMLRHPSTRTYSGLNFFEGGR
jgi:hypothetical protein